MFEFKTRIFDTTHQYQCPKGTTTIVAPKSILFKRSTRRSHIKTHNHCRGHVWEIRAIFKLQTFRLVLTQLDHFPCIAATISLRTIVVANSPSLSLDPNRTAGTPTIHGIPGIDGAPRFQFQHEPVIVLFTFHGSRYLWRTHTHPAIVVVVHKVVVTEGSPFVASIMVGHVCVCVCARTTGSCLFGRTFSLPCVGVCVCVCDAPAATLYGRCPRTMIARC